MASGQVEQHVPIEEMELFRRCVEVADWAWEVVVCWSPFSMDTVGKQLVRAIDSVGANLVEGDGRYGDADALHFFVIARASARETRYWLRRSVARSLLPKQQAEAQIELLAGATQMLNALIRYRRTRTRKEPVRERRTHYQGTTPDPFAEE